MADRIQLRRDTAANWTSANPVLAQGEPGYETDTGTLKFGDGVTDWNSLSAFNTGGGDFLSTTTGGVVSGDVIVRNLGGTNNSGFFIELAAADGQTTKLDFSGSTTGNTGVIQVDNTDLVTMTSSTINFAARPTVGAEQLAYVSELSGGGGDMLLGTAQQITADKAFATSTRLEFGSLASPNFQIYNSSGVNYLEGNEPIFFGASSNMTFNFPGAVSYTLNLGAFIPDDGQQLGNTGNGWTGLRLDSRASDLGNNSLWVRTSDNTLVWTDNVGTDIDLLAGGGGGDVSKVGTPQNTWIATWTGDGTIQGQPGFLWNGSLFQMGGTNLAHEWYDTGTTDDNFRFAFVSGELLVQSISDAGAVQNTVMRIDPNAEVQINYSGAERILTTNVGSEFTGGEFLFKGSDPILKLQDTSATGNAFVASIEGRDSVGGLKWRIGDWASASEAFYIELGGEIILNAGQSTTRLYGNDTLSLTLGADGDVAINSYIDGYGGSPSDGQVLTWNTTNGRAEFATPAGGGGIGGSIANDQIAVGAATTDEIEGSTNLTWAGEVLGIRGALPAIQIQDSNTVSGDSAQGYIRMRGSNNVDMWRIGKYSSGALRFGIEVDGNPGLTFDSSNVGNFTNRPTVGAEQLAYVSELPAGGGDMLLNTAQTITADKKFADATFLSFGNSDDMIIVHSAGRNEFRMGLNTIIFESDGSISNDSGSTATLGTTFREWSGLALRSRVSSPADGSVWIRDSDEELVYTSPGGSTTQLSNQAGTAPDVFKVGTPANNQLAVWTGDGTIEGEGNLTYDGTNFQIASVFSVAVASGNISTSGYIDGYAGTPTDNQVLTWNTTNGRAEFAAPPAGGSPLTLLDEGVSLSTNTSSIDFVGAGVTATNVGNAITVTIAGGGGGGAFTINANRNVFEDTQTGYTGTGFDNFLVGQNAGTSLTSSSDNIAMGVNALSRKDSGSTNPDIGIGDRAGRSIGTGPSNYGNIAIGRLAIGGATSGSQFMQYNIGLGIEALSDSSMTTASNNIAIGYRAGRNITTGNNNIFIGHEAGDATSTGSGNIVIGADVDTSASNVSNQLRIDNQSTTNPLIQGNFANRTIGFDGAIGEHDHDLGAGTAIDPTNGTVQETGSLTGVTRTFTFPTTNLLTTKSYAVTLFLENAGGATSLTWTGVLWPENTEPSWTTTGTDVATIIFKHNGTSWDIYGFAAGTNMA